MMLTFKQFMVSEGKFNSAESHIYLPKAVNDEALVDWCEANAPKFLSTVAQRKIWRGMDEGVMGIIDTNKFNRKSANTYNHYTIWMDNHPSWADYPKRSKALICTTDYSVADGFGAVKLVIPADSNKIGICPDDDLWTSFGHLTKILATVDKHKMYLDDVTSMVNAFIEGIFSKAKAKEVQEDYGALVSVLKRLTRQKLEYYSTVAAVASDYTRQEMIKLAAALEAAGLNSMYDMFEEGFDPKRNTFKLTTAAKAGGNLPLSAELWIQGQCAIIDVESINDDRPVLKQFCQKYGIRL